MNKHILLIALLLTASFVQAAFPVLQRGDKGDNVKALQYLLNDNGVSTGADGSYGPGTAGAVSKFQSSKSMAADGIAGSSTIARMVPTISRGSSRNNAVKAAQLLLSKHGIRTSVDGAFGPGTQSNVQKFQSAKGLTSSSGTVDQATWEALFGAYTSGGSSSGGSSGSGNWGTLEPIVPNNSGLSYARQSTMKSVFGIPGAFTRDCGPVTNSKLKRLMVWSKPHGHFKLTGLGPAVDLLMAALDEIKSKYPTLYSALTSAGMLCCRAVRGSKSSYSNHSWGTTIDFKINGVLDPRYDRKAQRGLNVMAPIMAKYGFFWGGWYSAKYEDAMHFEMSNEKILELQRAGKW